MSTKDEIIEQLTEKGIDFDPSSTKAELQALLPGDEGNSGTETIGDVEVGDPQLLRPVELPLVVKPKDGGEWKNPEQARFAANLNAYAYKNPKKWAEKRNDQTTPDGKVLKGLVSQLIEIGKNPSAINKYVGNDGANISYSDKRISN